MTSIVQLRLGGRVNSRAISSVPEYDCAFLVETEAIQRLPTEPLKYVNLTFDGVAATSEIRCYLNSTGAELFGVESCDANHIFAGVPYFGTGQICTVRIVNTGYRLKEFSYTIPAADQIIPVQQEIDRWYKNP